MTKKNRSSKNDWIDLTVPMGEDTPSWPGDQGFRRIEVADMDDGDDHNLTRVETSLHFGTHMDAPLHFIADGASIDRLPVELFFGRAQLIDLSEAEGDIGREELEGKVEEGTRRLLIKTGNSDIVRDNVFHETYAGVKPEGVRLLVEKGVELLGYDYFSFGPFGELGLQAHRVFLGGPFPKAALEGVDLSGLEEGEYELNCFPLLVSGAEGAPARALVRGPLA